MCETLSRKRCSGINSISYPLVETTLNDTAPPTSRRAQNDFTQPNLQNKQDHGLQDAQDRYQIHRDNQHLSCKQYRFTYTIASEIYLDALKSNPEIKVNTHDEITIRNKHNPTGYQTVPSIDNHPITKEVDPVYQMVQEQLSIF